MIPRSVMWASEVLPWPIARVWYWIKRQTRGRYDQWRRDRAKVQRFQAFCKKNGVRKVHGKWQKDATI